MCLNPKKLLKKGKRKNTTYRGFEGEDFELNMYAKCGYCSQCCAQRANDWVVRNYYESKSHKKKCFITLTYADNPIIIIRKDMQDFLKKLRTYFDRNEKGVKIRTFYCMEYGLLNQRPHGHVIIYGWEDKNAQYLDVNKKGNIIYQSNIIQKIWGLGRTSYQSFNDHEAPYISLYETPKETAKRDYILTKEKVKELTKIYHSMKITGKRRKQLTNGLKEYKKILEESKKKYLAIREINGWSIALGWDNFYSEYIEKGMQDWNIYIEDKEFNCPTPWLKKLANMGYYDATLEILRREEEIKQEFTEAEERKKAEIREEAKRKKELLDWTDTRNKIENL